MGKVSLSRLFSSLMYEEKIEYVQDVLKIKNSSSMSILMLRPTCAGLAIFLPSGISGRNALFLFKLYADQNLGFLQYRFVDVHGDEIDPNDNPDTEKLVKKTTDVVGNRETGVASLGVVATLLTCDEKNRLNPFGFSLFCLKMIRVYYLIWITKILELLQNDFQSFWWWKSYLCPLLIC